MDYILDYICSLQLYGLLVFDNFKSPFSAFFGVECLVVSIMYVHNTKTQNKEVARSPYLRHWYHSSLLNFISMDSMDYSVLFGLYGLFW